MSIGERLRELQDAWTPPPFEEREVCTEEDRWDALMALCHKRASMGCATTGYTLATEIETQEQYDAAIAERERFRQRLEDEGMHIQKQKDVPWKATYETRHGEVIPTRYQIHFVVTWR